MTLLPPRERTKILCVDDEPLVLDGLSLQLNRRYHVLTATSGAAGLEVLAKHPDVTVVLSDMRMPGMDGTAFLARARRVRPQAARILLTGYSDLDAAIAAVNEGQLFRFLTKPCPPPQLLMAVAAASEQHKLFTAEHVLLDQTLRGSIKALTDVLAITSPVTFGRAARIRALVIALAEKMDVREHWPVEIAAMLSQLGYISLPPETVLKIYEGRELSEDESAMVEQVPTLSEKLLSGVPRLELVRGILKGHPGSFRPPAPGESEDSRIVRTGANLLRVAVDFDSLEAQGRDADLAIEMMRAHKGAYDPAAIEVLAQIRGTGAGQQIREVSLVELRIGMQFVDDLKTDEHVVLAARGVIVTTWMLERLRNMRKGTVAEPIRVILPAARES